MTAGNWTGRKQAVLIKILAAIIAVALLLAYLGPLMVKMRDIPLGIVVVIGIVFMLVDLWHSLRKPED